MNRDRIIRYESRFMEDAEVAVICYGTEARPSLRAVKEARREGIRVGFFRLTTIWPFAGEAVRQVCERVKSAIVPEMNYGQVVREVERVAGGTGCHIYFLPKARLHEAAEVLQMVRGVAR